MKTPGYLPEYCAIHDALLYKITANKIYVATLKVDVSLNDGDPFGRSDRRTDDVVVEWAAATFLLSKFLQHFLAAIRFGDVSHNTLEFIVFV